VCGGGGGLGAFYLFYSKFKKTSSGRGKRLMSGSKFYRASIYLMGMYVGMHAYLNAIKTWGYIRVVPSTY